VIVITAKQEVLELAKALGAEVEINKTYTSFEVLVMAPKNHHWDEGVHELVESQYNGFDTRSLWKSALERMQEGIERCNHDCEWWD